MEQKYYTTGQAIQFFQKKGFSDFTEHNLIYLVANEKLKPCFFFQGVLIHSYIPSENNIHISATQELSYEDSLMAVMDDNFIEQGDPTTELSVDFRGYVSSTDIDKSINLLKLKENIEYINQVNVIEPFYIELRVGDKYVTAENLETDDEEFQNIKSDQTATFHLKGEGHPLYKYGHGIAFSNNDCLFSEVELRRLLPKQTELLSTQTDGEIVETIEQERKIIMIDVNPAVPKLSEVPIPKKVRTNALRDVVQRTLLEQQKMTTEELWIYFLALAKEGKSIFKVMSGHEDMLYFKNGDGNPLNRKRFLDRVNGFRDLVGI